MKTKHISYILALGISLLLLSCENVIEFSGEATKPLLVVNSFITPDSLIKVHVSKSRFFLQADSIRYQTVNNATVNVWVNGTKIEKLSSIGQGYYLSSFKPQLGDIIKITAGNAEFTEVSCYTEVISPNPILAADTTNHIFNEEYMIQYSSTNNGPYIPDTIGVLKTESFQVKIKFNDPAATSNYYMLDLKTISYFDNDSISITNTWLNSDDMVFGSNNNTGPFETGTYSYNHEFSDELINGKEYNLKFTFRSQNYTYNEEHKNTWNKEQKAPVKQELLIELKSISESYFKYLRSLSASTSTIEFFSEPVQIYSNVNGGIGILGSYSRSVYKINLK